MPDLFAPDDDPRKRQAPGQAPGQGPPPDKPDQGPLFYEGTTPVLGKDVSVREPAGELNFPEAGPGGGNAGTPPSTGLPAFPKFPTMPRFSFQRPEWNFSFDEPAPTAPTGERPEFGPGTSKDPWWTGLGPAFSLASKAYNVLTADYPSAAATATWAPNELGLFSEEGAPWWQGNEPGGGPGSEGSFRLGGPETTPAQDLMASGRFNVADPGSFHLDAGDSGPLLGATPDPTSVSPGSGINYGGAVIPTAGVALSGYGLDRAIEQGNALDIGQAGAGTALSAAQAAEAAVPGILGSAGSAIPYVGAALGALSAARAGEAGNPGGAAVSAASALAPLAFGPVGALITAPIIAGQLLNRYVGAGSRDNPHFPTSYQYLPATGGSKGTVGAKAVDPGTGRVMVYKGNGKYAWDDQTAKGQIMTPQQFQAAGIAPTGELAKQPGYKDVQQNLFNNEILASQGYVPTYGPPGTPPTYAPPPPTPVDPNANRGGDYSGGAPGNWQQPPPVPSPAAQQNYIQNWRAPYINQIKAQHPGASEGEIWRLYTLTPWYQQEQDILAGWTQSTEHGTSGETGGVGGW